MFAIFCFDTTPSNEIGIEIPRTGACTDCVEAIFAPEHSASLPEFVKVCVFMVERVFCINKQKRQFRTPLSELIIRMDEFFIRGGEKITPIL